MNSNKSECATRHRTDARHALVSKQLGPRGIHSKPLRAMRFYAHAHRESISRSALMTTPEVRDTERPLTVGSHARPIVPSLWDCEDVSHWPPDAFAIAASLLQKSGACPCLISSRPPVAIHQSKTQKAASIAGPRAILPSRFLL
jgi:hypothetical protein